MKIWTRWYLLATLLTVVQGCGRASSAGSIGCKDAPRPIPAAQVSRFLDSTQEMSKSFVNAAQFDQAGGTLWRFAPPITIAYRQHWMVSPMTVSIAAMKVQKKGSSLITLLRKTDDTVLVLEGGDRSLLVCN